MMSFYAVLKGFLALLATIAQCLQNINQTTAKGLLLGLISLSFLNACMNEQSLSLTTDDSNAPKYDQITFFQAKNKQGGDCDDEKRVICATVDIRYPEFVTTSSSGFVEKALNQQVGDMILNGDYETLDTKAENVEQLAFLFMQQFKATPLEADWSLQQEIRVLLTTTDLLSIASQRNEYVGGAHGSHRVELVSFDLKTGKPASLDSALQLGYEAELTSLADVLFRQQHGLQPTDDYEAKGFHFDGNQFALNTNFAFTQTGIRFYFNPYEVAAYAQGPTDLLIPYKDIAHLVKPNSFLSPMISSMEQ